MLVILVCYKTQEEFLGFKGISVLGADSAMEHRKKTFSAQDSVSIDADLCDHKIQ